MCPPCRTIAFPLAQPGVEGHAVHHDGGTRSTKDTEEQHESPGPTTERPSTCVFRTWTDRIKKLGHENEMTNQEILQATPLIWLFGVIVASILFRRFRGNPIFRAGPRSYRYKEGWISGYSHRGILTFLGGARNCLTVTLTDNLLTVHPNFPFSLFFLPEVYDLDHKIPIEKLRSVEKKQKLFSMAVDITYETARGASRTISMFVRDKDLFIYSLQMAARSLLPNPDGPPPIPPPQANRSGVLANAKVLAVLPIVCAILGIGGATFAFVSLRKLAETEQEGLSVLQSLHGSNIVRIVVAEKPGQTLTTISNETALASFANAANAIERYRPNHPAYDETFYVELFLQDGQRREYEFHTMLSHDEMIYMYFVHKEGSWTSYHGNGKSASLYQWMKKQGLIEQPQQSPAR